MKKRTIYITLGIACFISIYTLSSCQKDRLVEEWPDKTEAPGGRNGQAEQSDSTTTMTPVIDTNGWEGSIDVNFGFGGNETN